MKKTITALLFSLVACAAARAVATDGPVGAPEIDPASALSALTLLVGSLTVLRGRRTGR